MKAWRKWICLFLALCLLSTLCGCPGRKVQEKKLIAQRVTQAEQCFHDLDLDGLLDCIDPADVTGIRAAILLLHKIPGQKTTDLNDLVDEGLYYVIDKLVQEEVGLPEFDTKEALEAWLKTVSIHADEISFPSRRVEDEALANCVLQIRVDDDSIKTRVELKMIKSDGKWYIDLP